jgi:hypothetical protein
MENTDNIENTEIKNEEVITIKKIGRPKVEYESKQIMYKKYNTTYYETHKNDECTICDVCNGKYKWYNRSHHNKSKKHILKLGGI